MNRKYRNYNKELLTELVAKNISMAGLLKSLGLKPVGGNYANMKRTLQKFNLDTSHWTGQLWSKNKQLKDWSQYNKAGSLKIHLIKLRGHVCEVCKNSTWLEQQIKLEIHHRNCDRTNNELENLQLLCPNCHAFTDGFRNRKSEEEKKKNKKNYNKNLCQCGNNKQKKAKQCIFCYQQRKKLTLKLATPERIKLSFSL